MSFQQWLSENTNTPEETQYIKVSILKENINTLYENISDADYEKLPSGVLNKNIKTFAHGKSQKVVKKGTVVKYQEHPIDPDYPPHPSHGDAFRSRTIIHKHDDGHIRHGYSNTSDFE